MPEFVGGLILGLFLGAALLVIIAVLVKKKSVAVIGAWYHLTGVGAVQIIGDANYGHVIKYQSTRINMSATTTMPKKDFLSEAVIYKDGKPDLLFSCCGINRALNLCPT